MIDHADELSPPKGERVCREGVPAVAGERLLSSPSDPCDPQRRDHRRRTPADEHRDAQCRMPSTGWSRGDAGGAPGAAVVRPRGERVEDLPVEAVRAGIEDRRVRRAEPTNMRREAAKPSMARRHRQHVEPRRASSLPPGSSCPGTRVFRPAISPAMKTDRMTEDQQAVQARDTRRRGKRPLRASVWDSVTAPSTERVKSCRAWRLTEPVPGSRRRGRPQARMHPDRTEPPFPPCFPRRTGWTFTDWFTPQGREPQVPGGLERDLAANDEAGPDHRHDCESGSSLAACRRPCELRT